MLKNAKSAQLHYSLYVYLRTNTYELMVLIERLLWTNHPLPDARTSHLRTLSKIVKVRPQRRSRLLKHRSVRVSRPL